MIISTLIKTRNKTYHKQQSLRTLHRARLKYIPQRLLRQSKVKIRKIQTRKSRRRRRSSRTRRVHAVVIQKRRLAGTRVDSADSHDGEVKSGKLGLATRECSRRGHRPSFAFAALHETTLAEHGMEIVFVAEEAADEHFLNV